jgi:hypothetical protein
MRRKRAPGLPGHSLLCGIAVERAAREGEEDVVFESARELASESCNNAGGEYTAGVYID